jgi:predicted nucleic acid-binding protein
VTVVLDADVVIGALDASDAHHAGARLRFLGWEAEGSARLLSAVNLTEVLIAPSTEPARLASAREAIAALGIAIHSPNEAIAVDAARLRRVHPISVPDAYVLATARHVRASVATFDQRLLRAAAAEGLG